MNFNLKKITCLKLIFFLTVSCQSFKSNNGLNSKIDSYREFASTSSPECSKEKIKEILEPATDEKKVVEIDCSVKLNLVNKITKQLNFTGTRASGVVFDCNGASIDNSKFKDKYSVLIRSKKITSGNTISWIRPEDITIKNCTINGPIRIMGFAPNGEGEFVRESSRLDENHTERAQANAPKNILLDNINLIGNSQIPLYISPGVTYVTLQNSELSGKSESVAIYMDTESGYNVIRNNNIHTDTADKYVEFWGIKLKDKSRELIAVDGSAFNQIYGNRFSNLNHGGIYLYRNCGEGGTVRHQRPHHNHIINNTFYYNKYDGPNPAIYVGSRNGNRPYCDDDKGFSWGSSVDNNDFAMNNVVAENQIYSMDLKDAIKSTYEKNFISNNTKVSDAIKRKSGCFFDPQDIFLAHGEEKTITTKKGGCKNLTCRDGELKEDIISCQ